MATDEVELLKEEVKLLHELLEDIADLALRGLEEYEPGLRDRCRRIHSIASGAK